jgi:hypothetical protein
VLIAFFGSKRTGPAFPSQSYSRDWLRDLISPPQRSLCLFPWKLSSLCYETDCKGRSHSIVRIVSKETNKETSGGEILDHVTSHVMFISYLPKEQLEDYETDCKGYDWLGKAGPVRLLPKKAINTTQPDLKVPPHVGASLISHDPLLAYSSKVEVEKSL